MPLHAQRFLLFAWSYVQCAYWGLSFVLLDMARIHKFHSALYYSMHVALAGSLLFLQYSGILGYCKRLELALGPTDKKDK